MTTATMTSKGQITIPAAVRKRLRLHAGSKVDAIDTNILVRYLVEDDAKQAALAIDRFENGLSPDDPGFIPMAVVVEVACVLERGYGQSPAEVRAIVAQLLEAPHHDLADAIIHESGKAAGCERTLTLDRNFARLAGVEILKT